MLSLQNEISRTPPRGAPSLRTSGGEPILYAFGCALLENNIGDYFAYKIVNLDHRSAHPAASRYYTPLGAHCSKTTSATTSRIKS